ncbi:MAG: hypothetical protein R3D05_17685 [Dongiaceae bacterium]
MAHQAPPPESAGKTLMAAIFGGAAILALIGTFLPNLIGFTGTPALLVRVVFYAVAFIDVAVAFWLRARLRKAREARPSGGAVQRQ